MTDAKGKVVDLWGRLEVKSGLCSCKAEVTLSRLQVVL